MHEKKTIFCLDQILATFLVGIVEQGVAYKINHPVLNYSARPSGFYLVAGLPAFHFPFKQQIFPTKGRKTGKTAGQRLS